MDDVLGAFYPTICKKLGRPEVAVMLWDGQVGGDCEWVADLFPALYSELDYWSTISVLSAPSSIDFEIDHYITSIPAHLHDIREKWLKDNGFPERPLICTLESKVKTMKALGITVLIDDKPSTIKAVRAAGMIGIQFIPPYMKDYDKEDPFTVRHLSEVTAILDNLSETEGILDNI